MANSNTQFGAGCSMAAAVASAQPVNTAPPAAADARCVTASAGAVETCNGRDRQTYQGDRQMKAYTAHAGARTVIAATHEPSPAAHVTRASNRRIRLHISR